MGGGGKIGALAGLALTAATGGATAPLILAGGVAGAVAGKALTPKIPTPPALPGLPDQIKPPTESDPEVEAAKKKERKQSRLRSGRQSTILSNLRRELSPASQPGGEKLG